MLVAILDAGVGRAAGLGTAVGLEAARRLEGTAGLELAAANTFRSGTAGIGLTTMVAKTGVSKRGDGKRQGDRKTAKQRTTHEVSLQKKRLAVTGGTAEGHSVGEAGMPPETSSNSGTRMANVKKCCFPLFQGPPSDESVRGSPEPFHQPESQPHAIIWRNRPNR
jgi:hypothetical protein